MATDEAAGVTTAYIGVWGPGASYSWITVVDDPAGDRGHTVFGFENQGQCIAFVKRSRS